MTATEKGRQRFVDALRDAHRHGRLVVWDSRREPASRKPEHVIDVVAVAELMASTPALLADAPCGAALAPLAQVA